MPGYPLVVFGDDWGRHVSTMQHLLRHLFDRYPTVWVNGIGHRVPQLSDARRALEKVRAVAAARTGSCVPVEGSGHENTSPAPASADGAGPAVIVHPAVLPLHHWPGVGNLNGWSLTRSIRRALDEVGGGRPVVITGSPPSVAVLGRLRELATIYFCMDDWAHLPGVSPHMLLPLERRLLAQADAVVATAKALTRLKVPQRGSAHYLPQGVNFEHFSMPRPVPPEFAHLPRPWIGFAGGVGPALNVDIVGGLAAAFPQGSLILVGPEQEGLGILRAPNVHLLGPRPYHVLPAYVQAFDVGIIPYVRNEWTDSVDPLKLLEYLATGIPVVTTDLPEARKYENVVAIAANTNAFVAAVGVALEQNDAGKVDARRKVAAQNSWQYRAEAFVEILEGVVNRSRPV